MFDCALNDLAYLLGLICGRGSLDYEGKKVVIKFPFKLRNISQDVNQRDVMIISVDQVVNKLSDFTGKCVRKYDNETNVELCIPFFSNTHTWQIICKFYENKTDFHSFILPNEIYGTSVSFKENFIRGVGDTAGFITKGNADQRKRHRVYIEIPNQNWVLPVQLCNLLQGSDLNIPVQTMTWGHPNMRGDKNWNKEHQLKIYAEYYSRIGFTLAYKQQMLQECTNENKIRFKNSTIKLCDPKRIRIAKAKPIKQDEYNVELPFSLRGGHFNSFREICCKLGCNRCI